MRESRGIGTGWRQLGGSVDREGIRGWDRAGAMWESGIEGLERIGVEEEREGGQGYRKVSNHHGIAMGEAEMGQRLMKGLKEMEGVNRASKWTA